MNNDTGNSNQNSYSVPIQKADVLYPDLHEPYKYYINLQHLFNMSKEEFQKKDTRTLRSWYIREYDEMNHRLPQLERLKYHYNLTKRDKDKMEEVMQPYEQYSYYTKLTSLMYLLLGTCLGGKTGLYTSILLKQKAVVWGYVCYVLILGHFNINKMENEIEKTGLFVKYNLF